MKRSFSDMETQRYGRFIVNVNDYRWRHDGVVKLEIFTDKSYYGAAGDWHVNGKCSNTWARPYSGRGI